MAFSMVLRGMLTALASSIVYRSLRLSRGSPPFLAAMMILRAILLQIFPRLASVAPLARLIFDQCECPAMPAIICAATGSDSDTCRAEIAADEERSSTNEHEW